MKITAENVIIQLQKKNPQALEYLLDNYNKNIYSLTYRILKDVGCNEDIEECVSDVFVTAWENSHKYNPKKGTIKTWLFIVAKYKALDYRRKIYKEKNLNKQEEIELVSEEQVENKVIFKEEIKQIMTVIDNLGETDRQIFYRRYFFYEEIEDISVCLSLTRKAVDNRLWRIRKLLKEQFSNERRSFS
ncbi:sigma-70 family RNA polymerase sigma factor [Candidatus Contubernalis alkaliaceticus]|uniref:sigma-70 family RNA polymerase sigma factor n=1 Tax=Candidatus Contubernalis alkaliaceticus TaxID=338645 RepID=UPI001F4C09D1|nr:sigma-70 family RNA polymerase sigma factor [Candidatus Contubernalis alkalaceticus]UNC91182.1 sigma-70 family RNA polymerase sigma factor [Candidatus Contubernalis alkalaceticus]